MESILWVAFVGLIGAVIGTLGTMAGQWINAKHGERVERDRWQQEKAKEIRQAIREYRKDRAKPILDALDRASGVYSVGWDKLTSIMEAIGYYGEEIKPEQKEAYEKENNKRLQERLWNLANDVASVGRIPEPEIRKTLYKALWKGVTRPEVQESEHLAEIDDAYKELEGWIFKSPEEH